MTTPLDGSTRWRAERVDPAGWLAGPQSGGGSFGGKTACPATRDVVEQGATLPDPSTGRRAGDRTVADGAGQRAARRSARVRRRRVQVRSASRSMRSPGSGAADVPGAATVVESVLRLPVERGEPAVDGYQMGRWARLTLTLTVLTAVVVIAVSLTAGSAPRTLVDVTVGPGDTLWSIAAQAAPDRDPREVIDEIRDLNDMQGGVLPVGVVLRVPADTP